MANDNDVESQADLYNTTLSDILDQLAALKTREIAIQPMVPWFNEDIKLAIRERRDAERKWRHASVNKAELDRAQHEFYKDLISENSSQGQLFSAVTKLFNRCEEQPLPPHTDKVDLANKFGEFFHDKLEKIRATLDAQTVQETTLLTNALNTDQLNFSKFEVLQQEDVIKLIKSSKMTTCANDPIQQLITEWYCAFILEGGFGHTPPEETNSGA